MSLLPPLVPSEAVVAFGPVFALVNAATVPPFMT